MTGAGGSPARTPLVVVALQSRHGANGGITSLGAILTSLERYQAVVVTNRESAATQRWRATGIAVEIVPEQASDGFRRKPWAAMASYIRYFRALRAIMMRTGARIVHANDPLAFQLALSAVRSIAGARIALNIRDTLAPDRSTPLRRYRWLFGQSDHVLFLSQDMQRRWAEIVPDVAARSSVTYSIVDLTTFAPQPLSQETPRVVLVSGVICPKKGQLDFLRQMAPALTARGVECWLSGDFDPDDDAYAKACQDAAAALGKSVRFLGYQSDVAGLIARAHVVCVSSHYEGLMRTMIEAMAAGRPVVSTDVSSAREMLAMQDEEAGAVFPIGCGPVMAEAIAGLVEDEDANRRAGANGNKIARRLFAREAVVAAYENAYDALGEAGR